MSQLIMSRRTMLRGLGTAIALPVLESMIPTRLFGDEAKAAAKAVAAPKRVAWLYVPNGIHMPNWTPADIGPDYKLTPTLQPLAGYRDRLLVMSGLDLRQGQPQWRRPRGPRPRDVRLSHRGAAAQDRGRQPEERHLRRPGGRRQDRPPDQVPLPGARHGGGPADRPLRQRLQLRLLPYAFLAQRHHAGRQGLRSPLGVRPPVHQRRSPGIGREPRAARERPQEHSRLRPRRREPDAGRPGLHRPAEDGRVSHLRPGNRGPAGEEPGGGGDAASGGRRAADLRPERRHAQIGRGHHQRQLRGAPAPHARHDGPCLSDRPHPRHHAALRRRAEQPDLRLGRRQRAPSRDLAPHGRSGQAGDAGQDQHLPRHASSPIC